VKLLVIHQTFLEESCSLNVMCEFFYIVKTLPAVIILELQLLCCFYSPSAPRLRSSSKLVPVLKGPVGLHMTILGGFRHVTKM